jgi:hypothetical protein
MAKKKKNTKKGEVNKDYLEVFEIEKDGKEKEVVKESHPHEEHSNKEEMKHNKKQLKIILGVLGGLILVFVLIIVFYNLSGNVKYDNVKFQKENYCDSKPCLTVYHTSLPLYSSNGSHTADYNFYIRTNPKELKEIPFEGNLVLKRGYTMNITDEFNCEGDGTIAFANLVQQYQIANIVYINDENASCDSLSRYDYYEFHKGNETRIVQRGNQSCYDIYVNNCEILPATEKIMAETFSKL